MRTLRLAAVAALVVVAAASVLQALPQSRPALSATDIDAISQLLAVEDARQFDEAALARLLTADHPEVRRRTLMTIARVVDPRGRALLVPARADADPEVRATVAFATGQLKDNDAVGWLGDQLGNASTPSAIAHEAASALGKIRTPEARAVLAHYLSTAPVDRGTPEVAGEALLAIGRFTTREDLGPILRWVSSRDAGVRWRAAWALFRPRDPAAFPHLLALADDPSGEVRLWAIRGLAPPPSGRGSEPPAAFDRARASARVIRALRDGDRRVRTEAVRALVMFDDDVAFKAVLPMLASPDTWLSVSAAEGMGRYAPHAVDLVPALLAAANERRPLALRITALTPLAALAPDAAVPVAASLVHSPSAVARAAGLQALQRLGAAGRAALDALAADPATRALVPAPAGRGGRGPAPARPVRTAGDYRRLVETWIVPDYNGAAKPRAMLETPRGTIELELYAGDAPFGMDYFMRVVESGAIVGTEFGRVVPDFVAQQRGIGDDAPLRDEVNRRGLLRGTLSWASSGLDTGRPGYTLGSAPQPHNEGDFTALGHVIDGLDVVDRLDLGDAITAARIKR